MRYLEEFRDADLSLGIASSIKKLATRKWTIMEVCGGQTHTIVSHGLDDLCGPSIDLVHGPGCPVCVTPVATIDEAIAMACLPGVIFCTFGDVIRVPGTDSDLLSARGGGADVRTVYSPLDALEIAKMNPSRQVVFFAVGFETTAPANALAALRAVERGVENFSLLSAMVLVVPAMQALCRSPDNRVQGFLAAGHVCTVTGTAEYEPLAEEHRVPIVVTGFEPVDILSGLHMCVESLEGGKADVRIQYSRTVRPGGNPSARDLMDRAFVRVDREWRGMGIIGASGLDLAPGLASVDARSRFVLAPRESRENTGCISGRILRGNGRPTDCPHFGTLCTPERPLGATMVSSEGACAAYHRYRLHEGEDMP